MPPGGSQFCVFGSLRLLGSPQRRAVDRGKPWGVSSDALWIVRSLREPPAIRCESWEVFGGFQRSAVDRGKFGSGNLQRCAVDRGKFQGISCDALWILGSLWEFPAKRCGSREVLGSIQRSAVDRGKSSRVSGDALWILDVSGVLCDALWH